MIRREDILSIGFLEKSEYTGCCKGMRYRLEGLLVNGGKGLKTTIWPEPYNYAKTPEEQKVSQMFEFSEDGVNAAVAWMNDRLSPKG
jgi:hypothetical protein